MNYFFIYLYNLVAHVGYKTRWMSLEKNELLYRIERIQILQNYYSSIFLSEIINNNNFII